MNFKDWVNLNEMPITGYDFKGEWPGKRKYGWSAQDVGVLTKGKERNCRKWSNTKQNYKMCFVKTPQFRSLLEIGEVTPEEAQAMFDDPTIQADPNSIQIFFTQNLGSQKVPMFPWMMAHRFGHALAASERRRQRDSGFAIFAKEVLDDLSQILKQVYGVTPKKLVGSGFTYPDEKSLKKLASAVGSMKSAQTEKLSNYHEFPYELLAQYLMKGKITFNELPESLILRKRFAWGNPAHQKAFSDRFARRDWSEELEYLTDKYESMLDDILQNAVGKIYVM